jgi:hypothetical protein
MGRVCAHWYHGGDEKAAARAMVRGEATYLPQHLHEALKSEHQQPSIKVAPDRIPSSRFLLSGKPDTEQEPGTTSVSAEPEPEPQNAQEPASSTSVQDRVSPK